ncbi:hypothetical protein FACS1894147_09720 [Spirochaetia bacterium]|nr:hypothetical protein FACS1894147_09720 [Spirochaetia bacterium]
MVYRFIKLLYKKLVPPGVKIKLINTVLFQKLATKIYIGVEKTFHIEVHIAEHCNLKCKYCSHFSPLADESYLSPEEFEKDILQLSKITKNLQQIILLGGEPLLHPRIVDFITIAKKYFSNTGVMIITNGIPLLKQSESFWECCKNNKVIISISYYPIKLNYDEISKMAAKYNVSIAYSLGREDGMIKLPLDLKGGKNYKRNFKKCGFGGTCVTLRSGKLFTCPTSAHIQFFNAYFDKNLEINEADYIDIYKVKDVNEIFKFLQQPVPFCRYCNMDGQIRNLKWEVSKKEISEWT